MEAPRLSRPVEVVPAPLAPRGGRRTSAVRTLLAAVPARVGDRSLRTALRRAQKGIRSGRALRTGAWLLAVALWAAGCGSNGSAAGDGGTGGDAAAALSCAPGTYDHDRNPLTACRPWSTCAPGTFVATAPSATQDRVCQPCAAGTYAAGPNATSCVAWTTCRPGEFVAAVGNASIDQSCRACPAGLYSKGDNAPTCTLQGECAPGTEQTAAATATSPALCTACPAGSFCAGGTAARVACGDETFDHDGDPASPCQPKTICPPGQAVAGAGSDKTDRACKLCPDGTFSSGYNAGTCTPFAICAAGEFVKAEGTTTADRLCLPCPSGQWSGQTNAPACLPWRTCLPGSHVSGAPTALADRACELCAAGSYSVQANQAICLPQEACPAGTVQSMAPTSTSPGQCSACPSGTYCAGGTAAVEACPAGAFDDDKNAATPCVPKSACAVGTYVTAEGGPTSDRTCAACPAGLYSGTTNAAACTAWSACQPGSAVSAEGTARSDRACAPCAAGTFSVGLNAPACTAWRTCLPGTLVANNPSATTDRVCAVCAGDTWDHDGNPATACVPRATCAPGKYVLSPGSATTNRTCGDCAGGYTTTTNAPSCTTWRTCGVGQIETAAGSATTDRTCGPAGGWPRQWGTDQTDQAQAVTTDGSGNVYVAGNTDGSLYGAQLGGGDVFVTKLAADGSVVWGRQWGSASAEILRGVAVDGSGNVYAMGYTAGSIGGMNLGSVDLFLTKLNADGTVAWTTQWGTSSIDLAFGVAVDGAGHAFVGGAVLGQLGAAWAGDFDAFVTKFDTDGTAVWTTQWGTSGVDAVFGVALGAGGVVYTSGLTNGSLAGMNAGEADAFATKLNADGTIAWSRQWGAAATDYANSLALDGSDNLYVGGYTTSALSGMNAGEQDAFVTKVGSDGTMGWTRQWGTSSEDQVTSVAVDGSGFVYATGYTYGSLSGTNAGDTDAFLTELNPDGTIAWTQQFGTSTTDQGTAVSVTGTNVFVVGFTSGSLAAPNAGQADLFVKKLVGGM